MTRQEFRRKLAKARYVTAFVADSGCVDVTKVEALRWIDTRLSDHTRRPDLYPPPVVYLPEGRIVIGCNPHCCPKPYEEVLP